MASSGPVLKFLGGLLGFVALASPVVAGVPVGGWELEKDVDTPTYALSEPHSTDLNIDMIVLSCEQGPQRRGLQLSIHLLGSGPLAPLATGKLKDDPRLELIIDGKNHAVWLLFAGNFIVVADSADGAVPLLSDRLVNALRHGRQLELRFDFLQEQAGQAPGFDGRAMFELQAGRGGSAVATVKRCADDNGLHLAETSRRR